MVERRIVVIRALCFPLMVSLVVALSCLPNTRKMTLDMVRARGKVLKEYPQGRDQIVVMREGQRITKYRVFDWATDGAAGTRSELQYMLDTMTETCFTGGQGQTPVDCEKLKRDPDLVEHITW